MSFERIALAALVALAAFAGDGLASAAPTPRGAEGGGADVEAEGLLRRGVELRRQGHDDEALGSFREAFRLHPSARAQAQIGLASQALGHWADAEASLAEAIRVREDPWIAKNMATLVAAHEGVLQHLGQLQVLGGPAGAIVQVDDRQVGTLPMKAPVRVPTGEVVIAVSAPGFLSIVRRTSIPSPKAVVRENIVLLRGDGASPSDAVATTKETKEETKAPHPSPASPAGGAFALGSASAAPGADGGTPASAPRDSSSARSARLTWAAVTGGAGLLFLGVGATAQVMSSSKSQAFNDVRNAPNSSMQCNTRLPEAGGGPCQGLLDAVQVQTRVAIAGYVLAGLAAATSLTLFLTAPPAESESGHGATAFCAPSSGAEGGGAGFACALTVRL